MVMDSPRRQVPPRFADLHLDKGIGLHGSSCTAGLLAGLLVLFLLTSGPGHAQPLGGGLNRWSVVVPVDGKNQAIMVLRDAFRPDLWYFSVARPRIVTKGGKPVFAMTKYQKKTSSSGGTSGALLQFAVNLDLPDDAKKALRTKIVALAQKQKLPTEISIAPLPYQSIRMRVFSSKGPLLAQGAPEQKELVTSFPTDDMVFTLSLSELGTDVYADLCKNGTGIPVYVSYTYSEVTPPCGFTVNVDWRTTYIHLSSSSDSRFSIGWLGMGLDSQVSKQKVRETLIQKKCITVKSIAGEAWKQEDLDAYLDPVVARIYNELYNTPLTRIDKVLPAGTKEENPSDGPASLISFLTPSIKFETSFELKKIESIKTGSETFEMMRQTVMEKTGGCGGFIGIGSFLSKNPGLENELVTVAESGEWEKARYILPKIAGADKLGISQVNLSLSICDTKGQLTNEGAKRTVSWTTGESDWKDIEGKPVTEVVFPAAWLYEAYRGRMNQLSYKIEAIVSALRDDGSKYDLTSVRTAPLMAGEIPLSTPLQALDPLWINASKLHFGNPGLQSVDVALIDPRNTHGMTFDSSSQNKRVVFLYPSSDSGIGASVTASIVFRLRDEKGKRTTLDSMLNNVSDVRLRGPEIYLLEEWKFPQNQTASSTKK